jgi:hypothetical protein
MPWKAITELSGCESLFVEGDFSRCFVIRSGVDETGWMIGPYGQLTRFAARLRYDAHLRNLLTSKRVRIGFRKTDVPPVGIARQLRYGPVIVGENRLRDFTDKRPNPVVLPVRKVAAPISRKSDREQNVSRFWVTQTPQSHHIVEFNSLNTLGVSTADGKTGMDYLGLPAVLLAAEFHQRYISAILKQAHSWEKEKLHSRIGGLYRDLYQHRSKLFEPLWLVSSAILERAGVMSD